eukprot:7000325-Prorocentrum_lima.AAC.2
MLDPRVLEDLRGRWPLARIHMQQRRHEVSGSEADALPLRLAESRPPAAADDVRLHVAERRRPAEQN